MAAVDLTWLSHFAIVALAVYRVSYMLAMEAGPFDVFEWIRNKTTRDHWLGKGLRCPMCLSFWFGFIGSIFVPFVAWHEFIFNALALSAVAVIITKKYG